jgi:hypothetical protein
LLGTRTAGNESGSAGCAALRVTQFSVWLLQPIDDKNFHRPSSGFQLQLPDDLWQISRGFYLQTAFRDRRVRRQDFLGLAKALGVTPRNIAAFVLSQSFRAISIGLVVGGGEM